MNPKVVIIIVNWNGLRFLKDCLDSVYRQTYQSFNVYLVDNGSEDESISFVRTHYPNVHILPLGKNTGFAKGNNEGMKEVFKHPEIDYIACLNNDTIVDEHWLEELIKTVKKDEKIGAVSSKAYFIGGEVINNAGLAFEKVLQRNRKGGISIGYGLMDAEAPELRNEIEVFAAGGVAPLYRRDVLEQLYKKEGEVFDEDFFAYVEDLDLGFRIRKLDYKAVLAPKATLIHLHSQTGGKASPFKAYYCERNTILTAIKNLPIIDILLFPIRNIVLKLSYLTKKHESVKSLQGSIGAPGLIWILIKANVAAFLLFPKFILKRIRIR